MTDANSSSSPQRKLLMIILDGWGLNKAYPGNAIHLAHTPNFDQLWGKGRDKDIGVGPSSLPSRKATARLQASGKAVGLPAGQMGNSEVGHLAIGSGRVLYQDLVKINQDIAEGNLEQKVVLLEAIEHAREHKSQLHIKGLYSPGGVHSHQKHIKALLELAKKQGLDSDQVMLHLFTDGRDVPPRSALEFVQGLEQFIQKLNFGHISTVIGRYYAMDRDQNWERTDLAFQLLTQGEGQEFVNATQAIKHAYQQKISDEFIKPSKIKLDLNPGTGQKKKQKRQRGLIQANDSVIFANFRADRPRQLVQRFLDQGPSNLYYATMTTYDDQYPVHVVYPEKKVEQTLAQVLSQHQIKQLHITETVKYPHLTFFLNGKYQEPFPNEDWRMIKTYADIATHDQKPQMRTPDIAAELAQELKQEKYQVIITNFANGDMVGHTGDMQAAAAGCEVVDQALGQLLPLADKHQYQVMILADHGNCEQMLDEKNGEIITAHSNLPVPLIIISEQVKQLKREQGTLADVAPTALKLLQLPIPTAMSGKSMV
jgi:2,3-bisphosphoglycerate-independent phosphoglycerate mutase